MQTHLQFILKRTVPLVEETRKDVKGIKAIHADGTYFSMGMDCRGLNMSLQEAKQILC